MRERVSVCERKRAAARRCCQPPVQRAECARRGSQCVATLFGCQGAALGFNVWGLRGGFDRRGCWCFSHLNFSYTLHYGLTFLQNKFQCPPNPPENPLAARWFGWGLEEPNGPQRCQRGFWLAGRGPGVLSHRMYVLIRFRKSTALPNRQLIVYCH